MQASQSQQLINKSSFLSASISTSQLAQKKVGGASEISDST